MPHMTRFFLTALILLYSSVMHAVNYNRIEAIKKTDDHSISHIYQTQDNAIWISSSSGILRYDGKNAQNMRLEIPGWKLELECGERRYIWSISTNSIQMIDALTLEASKIIPHEINIRGCKTMARGDSLFIGLNEHIWCCNNDSLYLHSTMPSNESVSSMINTSDRRFLISTTTGKVYENDCNGRCKEVLNCGAHIRKLYEDSKGRLWMGLMQGGVVMVEKDFSEQTRYSIPIKDARALCEDRYGNILIGSSEYLYTITTNGEITREEDESPGAHSVTVLLKDNDENIWIGTYYNGVYYSNSERCPFSRVNLKGMENIKLVNAIAKDSYGNIWIATDQYGLHRITGSVLSEIPDTRKFKLKSILYDKEKDCLWMGRDRTSLLRYGLKDRKWDEFYFRVNGEDLPMIGANAICSHKGELLIGSSQGVWVFNPEKENCISRKYTGYEEIVHDVAVDSRGRIWIGGNGLFICQGDSTIAAHKAIPALNWQLTANSSFSCFSIREDEIWMASQGNGIIVIDGNGYRNYTTANSGLKNNNCLNIMCMADDNILIGTAEGISIMNRKDSNIFNFNQSNGLRIGSMREGCIFEISNTQYLIGGTDGLELYETAKMDFTIKERKVRLERIRPNYDNSYIYKGEERIIFGHDQKNFSFHFASHDYENIVRQIYEYRLEGYDSGWRRFELSEPIRFMNMKHGKYHLDVRRYTPGKTESISKDISLDITLRPAWYEALVTKILALIMILTIIGTILFFAYSKLLLRQKLKHQEEVNNERTRFFIRISHQLRTPLSLVLGQLEMFLKKNEKNASGIKHLENTYRHALDLKKLLGNFVELENKVLTPQIDDLPSEEEIETLLPSARNIPQDPIADSGTMLIVDDNAGMLSLLRNIFADEYKILEAINGADALELAKTMQPDIIISDVMMPVMDGLTLCARLRNDFTTSHIPIILLTAHASWKHNIEGLGIGADDYIAKPFSVDILKARCKNLLHNRKMLQNKYNMIRSDRTDSNNDEGKLDKRDTHFINAVIGAIERHLHSGDLCTTTLAEELSVSTSTLNNRLTAICNMSTRVFIEDIKLRHARKMIEDGHNISETADILGFSSPKYFTIRFKKKYGKSPSSFK